MVSGGTYGTEEIIHGAGYGHGILILLFLPVLWCLPTAFMIGELSSALPQEGGYYAWVRRGLGNFWGSVALAGRKHLRHGDLPDIVCILFEADVAVVWPGESRDLRRAFCGGDLRNSESCGDSRGGNHFAMAFLSAIGAIRGDCSDGTAKNRSPDGSTRRACRDRARFAWRRASGDVELHGLGQRLDDCAGSGAAAEDLSESHDGSGGSRCADLCAAVHGGVLGRRSFLYFWRRRLVGHGGGSAWRKDRGIRMAEVPDRARGHDERVRDVQRAGDELFATPAGDGARRHAAEILWQDQFKDAGALRGHYCVRDVLGAVPGAGVQAAGNAGHHALRDQLDAGICDAGGPAHPRPGVEARVPGAGRADGRDQLRSFSAASPDSGNGGKQS